LVYGVPRNNRVDGGYFAGVAGSSPEYDARKHTSVLDAGGFTLRVPQRVIACAASGADDGRRVFRQDAREEFRAKVKDAGDRLCPSGGA
jgi:hypothetical protein